MSLQESRMALDKFRRPTLKDKLAKLGIELPKKKVNKKVEKKSKKKK